MGIENNPELNKDSENAEEEVFSESERIAREKGPGFLAGIRGRLTWILIGAALFAVGDKAFEKDSGVAIENIKTKIERRAEKEGVDVETAAALEELDDGWAIGSIHVINGIEEGRSYTYEEIMATLKKEHYKASAELIAGDDTIGIRKALVDPDSEWNR